MKTNNLERAFCGIFYSISVRLAQKVSKIVSYSWDTINSKPYEKSLTPENNQNFYTFLNF